MYESENQAGSPHPTRSKRTRESLTACIVLLISIFPLSDELQPISVTLVHAHASIMETPQKHYC